MMMDIERLKELRSEVSNMAFIALSKLTDKNARANIVKTGDDLQKLIDEAIARQSTTSEEVAEAIEQFTEWEMMGWSKSEIPNSHCLKTAITALQAYQPWVSVENRLPESGKEVLMNVAYNNRNQSKYDKVTKGFYVESFSIKEETWSDFTGNEDYCEEDDTYYIRQGWYSVCNFVDDFSYIDVPSGFTVTHWKPLPEPPKGETI